MLLPVRDIFLIVYAFLVNNQNIMYEIPQYRQFDSGKHLHFGISIGWVNSDAFLSCFQILIVLSASPVTSLVPVPSNSAAKISFTASNSPAAPPSRYSESNAQYLSPKIASSHHVLMSTPSSLTTMVFTMALCPEKFLMKSQSDPTHFLIL